MVLIKDWSLLLEAAMLALWPKPQQMCCFCFSLANWQPSASSPRTARERKSSTPPATNKVKDEANLPHVSRGRKKGTRSFCGEKPRDVFTRVCTCARVNKRNTRADSGQLLPAAIRKFLPCVARSLNSWVIGALVCPAKAT